jgi:multiple sugar transport system permease protein
MTALIESSNRASVPAATAMGSMRRAARRRRHAINVLAVVISAVLILWTLIPLYNMVLIALRAESDVFSDHILPVDPTLESFRVVVTQDHWYLEHFWHQFRNSIFIAAMVTLLVLTIGTLTTFSISRMRIRNGWLVTNAALLTYMIPASFLAIPFYLIMKHYGLQDNPWSVIAALTTFATPYAIFIFQEYGRSIPLELDESARIDGASPVQIYFRIYLPLMAPALVAVGTYAMLLAWNEYLYQFLLLSQKEDMTVPVALPPVPTTDIAPSNYMMATAIIYALPPICIYYTFRHRMSSGLTMGGVKG